VQETHWYRNQDKRESIVMKTVNLAGRTIGDDEPCYIIAEVGINHNGDVKLAKKLIAAAHLAGCDAVKFQKRTIEVVYSQEELSRPRENPFGDTNGDLKRGLEFAKGEYDTIYSYCEQAGIICSVACWDEGAVDFMEQYNPPYYKIASASITDDHLLRHHRSTGKPLIVSTGMSTLEQIDHAVEVLGDDNLVILHCTSTYPGKLEELNLKCIQTLKERYGVPVGYSGHEVGLAASLAASVLGANIIERHITLDRAMWGSDQSASVETQGMIKLVRDIRIAEKAMGDGKKIVYESENPMIEKLRRV
jgi:N-acetylneuraminate synthase